MSNKKFNVYDKVRYIGNDHNDMPEFYPAVGTTGIILSQLNESNDVYVQWEKGSTSREDYWYCDKNDVELVKDTDMTNEEIWDFLKNKMEKNGLTSKASLINTHMDDYPNNEVEIIKVYYEPDVHNAIALAYKVGHLRSQKGRPFKIDEKKKKGGRWEPIDPNNLPKEGTKVRYSRKYKGYDWLKDSLRIETKGTLTVDGPYSRIGMILDTPTSFLAWADFEDEEAIVCLDMWVEDDE